MKSTDKPDGFFYFGWLLSGVFSLGLSLLLAGVPLALFVALLGDTINVQGQMRVTEDYLLGYSFIPLFGLMIGVIQYLLLSRYFHRMGWWILTTILGWAPAWLLISVRYNPIGEFEPPAAAVFALLAGAALGLLSGFLQWLLLRNHIRRYGWWIPVNMLGFGLAGVGMWNLRNIGQAALAVSLPCLLGALVWWLYFRAMDSLPQIAPPTTDQAKT